MLNENARNCSRRGYLEGGLVVGINFYRLFLRFRWRGVVIGTILDLRDLLVVTAGEASSTSVSYDGKNLFSGEPPSIYDTSPSQTPTINVSATDASPSSSLSKSVRIGAEESAVT